MARDDPGGNQSACPRVIWAGWIESWILDSEQTRACVLCVVLATANALLLLCYLIRLPPSTILQPPSRLPLLLLSTLQRTERVLCLSPPLPSLDRI